MDSQNKCIDLSYLNHRTKSNPDLMLEMITLYLNQTPLLVDAMNKCWANEDWESLYAAVHKLLPSFTIMGINSDFEKTAKKVQEFACLKQQSDIIPTLLLQLTNVLTQSCIELKEEYNTIKNLQQS